MSELIPLNDLAQEANDNHEQVISNAKKAISAAMAAGAALLRAKEQVTHGEWLGWQKTNLTYSYRTASRYMSIASNWTSMTNLKDANDINDALRMISERKAEEYPEHVPRAERKTGRVQVTESNNPESSDSSPERDPDPNPAPRTNTVHKPETAKAREADRPVPAAVTPEIVSEPAQFEVTLLSDFSVAEMIDYLKESADDPKKRAKELRKAADELDPPKKFRPPDVEDVRAYCIERKNRVDAEAFVAFYAQQDWRLANGNKISDWKQAVITWEKRDDSGNRNSSGGRVTTGRIKPTAEEPKITFV